MYCNNNPVMMADPSGRMPNWLKWLIGGIAFIGAVALTVVTGGALAPVFVGMSASIVVGGLIQGTVDHLNGGSFGQGFLNGAADGALWGGIFALGGAGLQTAKIFKNGVVIGESMSRVSSAAKHIGAATYKSPGKQFIKMFGGKNAVNIMKSQNTQWINRMVKWGVKITDIGVDVARPAIHRSVFYALEVSATNSY